MKVRLSIDNHGFLTITVISKAWNKKIGKHLKRCNQPWDGTLFVQDNVSDVLRDIFYLSNKEIEDLFEGWDRVVIIDPWTFLQMVGYDACELALNTHKKQNPY